MRIVISNYADAFEIGIKYMDDLPAPREPNYNDPYDMTKDAFVNTLGYIFHYLHHQCYMLCVKDNVNMMYKLQPKTTAPLYKIALKNAVNGLRNNPTLSHYQRKYIANSVSESHNIRLMQCIVKQIPDEVVDVEPVPNEYSELLKDVNLPNGVFIINLTDAVILRADGTHPFPNVVGSNISIGKYAMTKHLPIFSISGQRGYLDIQIPNYDDIMIVLGTKIDTPFNEFITSWDDKTINRAVFRGGFPYLLLWLLQIPSNPCKLNYH